MSVKFEYPEVNLGELKAETMVGKRGRVDAKFLEFNGEKFTPTKRFWQSFQMGFRISKNTLNYFEPVEIFERIAKKTPNDKIRFCVERYEGQKPKLLAMSKLGAPVIKCQMLESILEQAGYDKDSVNYANGFVRSSHTPKFNNPFKIAGDAFENKFVLDCPIDGFGKPQIYLSVMRLVCSNGAIGYAPTFRSEIQVGKGETLDTAMLRAIQAYNWEEGYGALRSRLESAPLSWASVREAWNLHKTVMKLHGSGELVNVSKMVIGASAEQDLNNIKEECLKLLSRATGDMNKEYGLSNIDAMSDKKQRVLPAGKCTVYDLVNCASELATHYATPLGSRQLNAYIGQLVSGEYDLEGTKNKFDDYRDFYIRNEDTAEVMAEMTSRSAN